MKLMDLSGMEFSRWKVLYRDSTQKRGYWYCKCECGTVKSVRGQDLRLGKSVSCGCYRQEIHTKHGYSYSPDYHIWSDMKERCTNPNSKNYKYYGARGIKVCDRWMNSFEEFISDMGLRPSNDLSIERIDVNGNYEPSNCKWATSIEQARNRRSLRNTTGYIGVHKSKGKWRAAISVNYKNIVLGYYDTIIEAAEARKRGEELYWGKSS